MQKHLTSYVNAPLAQMDKSKKIQFASIGKHKLFLTWLLVVSKAYNGNVCAKNYYFDNFLATVNFVRFFLKPMYIYLISIQQLFSNTIRAQLTLPTTTEFIEPISLES